MSARLRVHLPFIILCLILVVYLGLKTLPENGWGGWLDGLADAATLLSAEHWAKDGFINSKFLFIPIGYSKIVQYLDNPEMRHHARGTVTGELIGRRLYYTHYPSGYLFPYALLMKAGVTQRPYFRLLALIFSFSALILLYWFFNLLTKNPLISFFAILYYSISTMFLDFADSLANQPLDDLFRAIILVLSILAVRSIDNIKKYRIYNGLIWFSYFLLSISSYDSTFFIFIWLVGLDIITRWHLLKEGAEPRTKWLKAILVRGLFFASAPILSFILQILQNWWYLGNWREVWLDIFGTSLARVQTSSLFQHIRDVFYAFSLMTGFKTFWATFLVLILSFVLWKLKSEYFKKFTPFLLIFFLAGAFYPFILVGSGGFSYQGRQMMPLIAFLVGMATVFVFNVFQNKSAHFRLLSIILIIAVVFIWGGQIYRTVQYVYNWPNNKANDYVIQLGKFLKPMINGDAAVFYQGDRLPANFVTEYYFDTPILSFKREGDLVKDWLWFEKNSQYPFEAFVITDRKEISNNLHNLFLEKQVEKIGDIQFNQGEYIFKISP